MEPDINKYLTEEQLDDLIRQSFQRQQTIDDINVSVMKQLRHTTRRHRLMQLGKAVAFAFGLPMILLLFGWLLWSSISQHDALRFAVFDYQVPFTICLIFPIVTMLLVFWKAIRNFSPSDV